MGQRLVITAFRKQGDEPLFNIYYHWSAYSSSSLEELKALVKGLEYDESTTDYDLIKRTVEWLQTHGGGVCYDDVEAYQKRFDANYIDKASRNAGILAFTKEAKDNLQYWSEGDISVYLDAKEFDWGIYALENEEGLEYYAECNEETLEQYLADVPEYDLTGTFQFSEIDELLKYVEKAESENGIIKIDDDTYAYMIY